MTSSNSRNVAFLTANEGVEQIALTDPWHAVEAAGATPVLIAPQADTVQAFNHLDKADTFEATVSTADATVDDYVALVLPGGVANPDQLRTDDHALALVNSFVEQGKPIAVICHGSWTLIEAGVVAGRQLTSWPSLRTDLRNAGADWVDQEVVVCSAGPNTVISSRRPDDLPAFNQALVDVVTRAS
jgi:protease I